jgi:hypothetical protein
MATVGAASKRLRAAAIRKGAASRLSCGSADACAAALAAFPAAYSLSVRASCAAGALAAALRAAPLLRRPLESLHVRWLVDHATPLLLGGPSGLDLRTVWIGTPLADPLALEPRAPAPRALAKLLSLMLDPAPNVRDLAPLAPLASTLTSLHVAGTDGLSLSALAALSPLRDLSLTDCVRLADVACVAHLTSLTSLRLAALKPFLSSRLALDARALPPTLTCLDLRGVRFALAALAPLTRLASLRVALGPSAPDFAPLSCLVALRLLDYAGTTADGAERAAGLDALPPSLTSLRLARCAAHALPLASLTRLASLHVSDVPVAPDAVARLAALPALTRLDCEASAGAWRDWPSWPNAPGWRASCATLDPDGAVVGVLAVRALAVKK